MAEPTTVVVVDDQELLRQALVLILNSAQDILVVGEASDGTSGVGLVRRERPDVVLMDIQMPGGVDGIQATKLICADADLAATRVCILTMFDEDAAVFRALRAGASGYLLKDTPPAGVIDAIRTLAAGRSLLSAGVLRTVVGHFSPPARRPVSTADLTARQVEILRLIAGGLSNEEIEARLHISRSTCKTHITALLHRTGSRDRAQLVIFAYESGLVGQGAR